MRFNLPEISSPKLISTLRSHDLLPAIVFVPSRRRCDESATEVALDKAFQTDFGKSDARRQLFDEFVKLNPEIRNHKHRKIMLRAGIASHHAGHIPAWKLLIEKMMSNGLLNAIFATSTVAAGVDFPARSVVVSYSDTRSDDGWRPLYANEVQQMTGRAGRRGRDNVGFVILAPSRFQDPPKMAELLTAPPDPLESKFRSTYTNLLNLLDAFGEFEQVRAIAERSFAFRNTARQIAALRSKCEAREKKILKAISDFGLDLKLDDVRGFERLTSARNKLEGKIPATREEMRLRWLKGNVKEGRIVSKGKTGKKFLLVLALNRERVTALNENGQGVTVPLAQIKRVYKNGYPIRGESLDDAFFDIHEGRNPIVKEPQYAFKRDNVDESVALVERLTEEILPDQNRESARTLMWSVLDDAEYLERTGLDIFNLRSSIWEPFANRARVLERFGYLDISEQKVTESGQWLADLRLDRPLIVGEALKKKMFSDSEYQVVAGFMASLAADAERDYGELRVSANLAALISEFESTLHDVAEVEWEYGVDLSEDINFSAAATAELWASGVEWSELVHRTKAEEGDLVRLLSRTGEALMQIAHLGEGNKDSAAKARAAAEALLREPVR